jgi:ADP-ribose pyrophosphatase YjhB (NUDIX family)
MVEGGGNQLAFRGTRGVDYIGVGVGAVILNERCEVLLLFRKKQPEAGHWTIPGGAVEWFETCADAIRRECREEVGLDVDIDRLLTVVDHIVKDDGAHWVSIEYLVTVTSGEATNANKEENEEVRWFRLDALPDPMTQPTREALRYYQRTSGSGRDCKFNGS